MSNAANHQLRKETEMPQRKIVSEVLGDDDCFTPTEDLAIAKAAFVRCAAFGLAMAIIIGAGAGIETLVRW